MQPDREGGRFRAVVTRVRARLTLTTKPTFRAEFPQAAGGKTAVYMARWIGTRGEKGPWSEIATATVAE